MLLDNYHQDRMTLSEISGYLGLKVKHFPKLEESKASEIGNGCADRLQRRQQRAHSWMASNYRPRNFSFVWDRLGALIEEGRLKASIEVYNDFEKKDDEIFKWCKERKGKFVVDSTATSKRT